MTPLDRSIDGINLRVKNNKPEENNKQEYFRTVKKSDESRNLDMPL